MKNNGFAAKTFAILCFAVITSGGSAPLLAQTSDQVRDRVDAAERPPSTEAAGTATTAREQSFLDTSTSALPSITTLVNPAGRARQAVPGSTPREDRLVEQNVFEAYVENVTGKEVEVFGRSFFRNVPATFTPGESVPVNPDYTIGTGDELQIRAWGMIDIDVNVAVDRNGAIRIPRVGVIRVAGVAYRDLQGHLTAAVSKVFTNFTLAVSVVQSRAVQVYVVGHAVRPGTYTLNAMSTLLNALFTSGGPTASGSMRRIQVKRGGEIATTFDLYEMLIGGDKRKDISLRDGDVIYIPEAGPLVAMTGNVKQPAIYEVNGQSTIADALSWAGGFDPSTEGKQVVIEKSRDNKFVTIAEFPADSQRAQAPLAAAPLAAGDIVRVFAPGAVPVQISVQREYVRVSGEVSKTGVFELRKGETLRELLARLGGTTANGYLFATRLVRDSVRISQQARLDEAAVRFEREIEAVASQRLAGTADRERVALVTAELERQRELARRMRNTNAEGRIVLELADSNAQIKDLPDLPLQDGDTIFVPRKPGTVNVIGAVYQQNAIVHRKRLTVNDYLQRTGGLLEDAEKSEMYLIRADGTAVSARSTGWFGGLGGVELNPGDSIIVPQKVARGSWAQTFREWTTIFYQFGLGAAGLKVLKD